MSVLSVLPSFNSFKKTISGSLVQLDTEKSNDSVSTAGTGTRVVSCHRPVPLLGSWAPARFRPEGACISRLPALPGCSSGSGPGLCVLSRDRKRPLDIITPSEKSWYDRTKQRCQAPARLPRLPRQPEEEILYRLNLLLTRPLTLHHCYCSRSTQHCLLSHHQQTTPCR